MSAWITLDGSQLAGLTAAWALSRAGARVRVVSAGPLGGGLAERAPFRFEHGGRSHAFPTEQGAARISRQDRNLRRLLDTLDTSRALRITRRTVQILHGETPRRFPARVESRPLPSSLRWLTAGRAAARALARATAFDPALDSRGLEGKTAAALVEGLPSESARLALGWHEANVGFSPRLCGLAESLTLLQRRGLGQPRDSEYAVLSQTRQRALVGPIVAAIEAAGGEVSAGAPDPLATASLRRRGFVVLRLWFRGAPLAARADAGEIPGVSPVFTWLHRISPDFQSWSDATGGSVLEMSVTSTGPDRLPRCRGLAEQIWPELAGSYVTGQVIVPAEVARPPDEAARFVPEAVSPSRFEAHVVAGLEGAHRVAAEVGVDPSRLPPVLPPHPPSTVFLRARAALRRAGAHKGW